VELLHRRLQVTQNNLEALQLTGHSQELVGLRLHDVHDVVVQLLDVDFQAARCFLKAGGLGLIKVRLMASEERDVREQVVRGEVLREEEVI